ncbi:MAG: hypothetical protein EBX91_04880 [Actinobacteria bacterium]|nr:hypothetical protein [Actinomycetota bacterium]
MSGESALFWVLAPLAVLASVAMLFMKKAVHSAVLLAWVMITLAIFYIALEAPFLGIEGLAQYLFSDYVWAFEVISALLITAALGAMVLAHSEKSDVARTSQRARSIARFRGKSIATAAGLPGSGVYARNNALDLPALLPDGKPSDLSIAEVLHRRGDVAESKSYQLEGLPKIDDEGNK